jgi:hypothetical protein
VRETEKGYLAKCPAHEDQNPSLKIDQGNDGRVLLHCHAGCPVEAMTTAIGVRMRDLFHRADWKDRGGGGRQKHSANESNIRMPSRRQPESRDSDRSHNHATDAVDSNAQTAPPSGLTLEEYAQQKRFPMEFLRDLQAAPILEARASTSGGSRGLGEMDADGFPLLRGQFSPRHVLPSRFARQRMAL